MLDTNKKPQELHSCSVSEHQMETTLSTLRNKTLPRFGKILKELIGESWS